MSDTSPLVCMDLCRSGYVDFDRLLVDIWEKEKAFIESLALGATVLRPQSCYGRPVLYALARQRGAKSVFNGFKARSRPSVHSFTYYRPIGCIVWDLFERFVTMRGCLDKICYNVIHPLLRLYKVQGLGVDWSAADPRGNSFRSMWDRSMMRVSMSDSYYVSSIEQALR